ERPTSDQAGVEPALGEVLEAVPPLAPVDAVAGRRLPSPLLLGAVAGLPPRARRLPRCARRHPPTRRPQPQPRHAARRPPPVAARQPPAQAPGAVLSASAGTSALPVAEEAAVTSELMGSKVTRLYDVGVAGVHRVLDRRDLLRKAKVIVVVAGMEGALPSVVA